MANNRRKKSSTLLFRYLVLPTLFLCMIFHQQTILQWIALAALAIWLGVGIVTIVRNKRATKVTDAVFQQISDIRNSTTEVVPEVQDSLQNQTAVASPNANTADRDLLLIRQVNYRITEVLRQTYPMISWLWVKRPSSNQLISGGTWRIQVSHTDPFNYAEVTMKASGQLSITMLQATPLDEAQLEQTVSEDLQPGDILDRVDVREWFTTTGEDFLITMIDELNVQGHKKLLVRDNGEVMIQVNNEEKVVDTIQGLPPRMAWEEFCKLLKEDDIMTDIKPEGLCMSW